MSRRTSVVHCKKDEYDIYIGRPSIWGNPFIEGKHGTREEVLQKFHKYAAKDPMVIESLPLLKGKVLGCWCKPKDCHGDILAAMVYMTCADCESNMKCEVAFDWYNTNNACLMEK
jgi:hypothetical protein